MQQEKYYSIGEFATLCNTTKDTLHHYNQIGLLKPAGIAENGYRQYTIQEFFLFSIIRTLRSNGCSLDEIQTLLESGDTNQYIKFFEAHKQEYIKKDAELKQSIHILDHCIRFMKRSVSLPSGVPMVTIETEPIYLYVTPSVEPVTHYHSEFKQLMFHHLVAMSDNPEVIKYPVGGIMKKEDFVKENYSLSCLVSRSTTELYGEHAKTLHLGKCLSYLHQSEKNDIENAYQILQDYIEEHELEVCGDIFELGIIGDFSSKGENVHLTHIRIPIK